MGKALVAMGILLVAGCTSSPAPKPSAPISPPPVSGITTATTSPTINSTTTSAPAPEPPPYIASARWTRTSSGRSLHVMPTASGRTAGNDVENAAWREVLAIAPDAAGVSMRRQFVCHWRYAKGKATWNLEPWRAAVPLDEVVAAYCNPGGPE